MYATVPVVMSCDTRLGTLGANDPLDVLALVREGEALEVSLGGRRTLPGPL